MCFFPERENFSQKSPGFPYGSGQTCGKCPSIPQPINEKVDRIMRMVLANQNVPLVFSADQGMVYTRTKCQGSDSKNQGSLEDHWGGRLLACLWVERSTANSEKRGYRNSVIINTSPGIYSPAQVPMGHSSSFSILISRLWLLTTLFLDFPIQLNFANIV